MSDHPIPDFLGRVRSRINRGLLLKTAAICLLAGATACVWWAIGWRIAGYAAPRWMYVIVAMVAVISCFVWTAWRRPSADHAAKRADDVFGLKDGLLSWLDFRARDENCEAFVLHENSMKRKVADLDIAQVPVPETRKIWIGGSVAALLAVVLGLLPHSEAVRKRLALEHETGERTEQIAKEMEVAIEEMIRQMSEEERELVDENKLREWAKEIEKTKDQREAEKQMAKIEQQIALTMQGLEARQDEAVLQLAASELEKSSASDLRQLGKNLDAKDFDKAAEQLKEMKNGEGKMTPEQLDKLRQNAARTKEMAKRMADGARKKDFGKMNNKDGRNGAMRPGDGKQRPMQEMLDKMDKNARDLAGELEDGDLGEQDQQLVEVVDGEIDELAGRLGKLGARAKMKNKLKALRGGLAGARSFAQSRSQTLGLAQCQNPGNQPGGKQAGTGSVESRRNQQDELADNGNRVEVQSQNSGDGPSDRTVESAESGSGVSGRSGVAKEREFRQQFESMVRRDDIPESLKLGVREYFERVHETQEEQTK